MVQVVVDKMEPETKKRIQNTNLVWDDVFWLIFMFGQFFPIPPNEENAYLRGQIAAYENILENILSERKGD